MQKVLQNDLTDCGICCLKAMINYYHGNVSLEVLRHDTYTDGGGCDMYHLLEASKKYGFDGYGVKVEIEDIAKLTLPAICHTIINKSLEHFMVIEKIDDKYVYLMDPAVGNRKLKIDEFHNIFTNQVLVLYPVTPIINNQFTKPLLSQLKSIVKKEHKLLRYLIILTFLLCSSEIIYSFYFKIIQKNSNLEIILIFSIFLIFMLLFNYLKNYYTIHLNKNIDATIKKSFVKHIFFLPSYSIKSRSPGEILTRINELNNYKNLITEYLVNLLLDIIIVICTGIILIIINYQLFIILLLMIICYLIIGLLTTKKIKKQINDVITSESNYNTNLIENIEALDSLKNLHLEETNYQINEKLNVSYLYENFLFDNYLNKVSLIKNIIHEGGLFIINIIGILLIKNHQFDIYNLITFDTLLVYFKNPFFNYIDMLPKLAYIKTSFDKLNEFMQIDKEEFKNKPVLLNNGDIKFKNISISYNGIEDIIKNVSFTIRKNSKTMLIGQSGIGKSSLLKILYRTFDNYQGTVLINDFNIKDIDLNVIRSNIGYLGQKENLFSDTIYNNIVMNRVVSDEELNRICKICMIDEIIDKKPLRYQTMLIEGGRNLSGGERERILLARILLKYPEILILDEALGEVNETMERQILKNLKGYLRNRTLIYVTHRPINNYFDEVISLEN